MKPLRSAANSVAGMSISVAILVLVVLTSLGIAAPVDTHPFFYFGLILFGGGAVGLLFAGVGALFAGSRTPTVPSLDLASFAETRRMALAMWLCALGIPRQRSFRSSTHRARVIGSSISGSGPRPYRA